MAVHTPSPGRSSGGPGCVLDARLIRRPQQGPGRDLPERGRPGRTVTAQGADRFWFSFQHRWLPPFPRHPVTTTSTTEGVEKPRWAGMGRPTVWSVAAGPMGMPLWPPRQRWKQGSQSPDKHSRGIILGQSRMKISAAPAPKFGD